MKVSDAHADTDSDPSEELPLAARASAIKATAANATSTVSEPPHQLSITESAPISNEPSPDTPPASTVPTKMDKKRSHKKKGRNQHTRDREGHDEDSPARSQSRDIQKDDHALPGSSKNGGEPSSKSHSKAKAGMSSKITMTDMKRRAAALLDFISRTQVELAGETLSETRAAASDAVKTNNPDAGCGAGGNPNTTALEKTPQDNGRSDASPPAETAAGSSADAGVQQQREFKELNCIEMMDTLTRRLVKWQQEYAA